MNIAVSLICLDNFSQQNIDFLASKTQNLHFDIMDGTLTDCKGLPLSYIDTYCFPYRDRLEVHIISKNPIPFIQKCISKKCKTISVHIESNIDFFNTIHMIKENNIQAGLVVSPETPIDDLMPYLNELDLITVMTVNPGRAGQPFQKKELNKVVMLKKIREEKGLNYQIEIDGSCNQKNYSDIYKSGVDSVVVGKSGLFDLSDDLEKAWIKMLEYMDTLGVIYMHADLVGNPLKESIKERLLSQGYNVVDLYTDGKEEYPECARKVGGNVTQSEYNLGILCCGTGLGMSMVANKVSGIRAAVVSDVYSAQMAREHNDANVLCLGSRVITKETAYIITDTFLKSNFLFGKHTPRVDRFEQF